jgi:hypothetical protein
LPEKRFIDCELHQPRGKRANLSRLDTHRPGGNWIFSHQAERVPQGARWWKYNPSCEDASAVVLVAIRDAELAMVAIGIAIVARSDFALGALSRSGSPVPSRLLAAAIAIAVPIFCINLAPL